MNAAKFYSVEIEFKRPPAFGMRLHASDESEAKRDAAQFAIGCGFKDRIKKITVKEVVE